MFKGNMVNYDIPTGFVYLDKITEGLPSSELTVLAGRRDVGKTALALDIARNATCYGQVPAVYFSPAASVCHLSRCLRRAQSGSCADSCAQESAVLLFDDTPILQMSDFRDLVMYYIGEDGVRLVIVDYLQLMEGEKPFVLENMRSLAKELDIAILALFLIDVKRGRIDKEALLRLLPDYIIESSDTIILMNDEFEDWHNSPFDENGYEVRLSVAKRGMLLGEETTLMFNSDQYCFRTPDSVKDIVSLERDVSGPCPEAVLSAGTSNSSSALITV